MIATEKCCQKSTRTVWCLPGDEPLPIYIGTPTYPEHRSASIFFHRVGFGIDTNPP